MFCTKCGFEIKDGYKFCPKCGTPAFVEKEEPKGKVKKETDTTNDNYIPNPFMAKELDIEGIKKRAEEGDRYAMSLQCYRYEMGIGTEIDMEKHNELKKVLGGDTYGIVGRISQFYYSKELANPYILTKNK